MFKILVGGQDEIAATKEHYYTYLKTESKNIAPANGISIGMAFGSKYKIEDLIQDADRNMYESKTSEKI